MPFTLSHPAAVLPLRRGPLVLPALVAGSVVPDLSLFLAVLPGPTLSRTALHSLHGTVALDVPLALAALLVVRLCTRPLVALAPVGLQPALVPLLGTLRWSWWMLPSAWLGALTHVAWDAFTHADGAAVQRLPLLRAAGPADIRVFSLLQYASSLLGLAVLAVALRRWQARAPRRPVPPDLRLASRTRLTVLAAVGWAGLVAGARHAGRPSSPDAAATVGSLWLPQLIVGLTTGAALALLVWAAAWHLGLAPQRSVGARR